MTEAQPPSGAPNDSWQPEPPPPQPKNFSPDFFAGVHWHQKWELFQGVYTPGRNSVAELCDKVQLPKDLRGMRVLDIGAWNGGFSFECERRGAAEVVGYGVDNAQQSGFERIRDLLGSKTVRYEEGSVYNLTPERMGMFDIVLFLGVLYHLRYPMVGIDNVYSVTKKTAYVETHVMDHCFIPAGQDSSRAVSLQSVSPDLVNVPLWQFYRRGELGNDTSNWFGPNIRAVLDAFGSAGFAIEHLATWGYRAGFRAERLSGAAEHKTLNTYENFEVVEKSIAALTDMKKP
jgi:tRNA (mo5U34)-methyltransferase